MELLLESTPLLLDLAVLAFSLAMWPGILMSRKQPVVMLAWLLGVTFLPVIGPLFFVVFGRHQRLPALPRKKERSDRAMRPHLESFLGGSIPEGAPPPGLPPFAQAPIEVAQRVGDHPLTPGNRLTLLGNAAEKYEVLLADIGRATGHIHMEYFKLRDDGVGNRLADALIAKAREGLEVRLLIDGVGSLWLSRRYIGRLREGGVRFWWFHPLNPLLRRWSLNIRNHRKICVIDGKIGYLGGINLGDEHLGADPSTGEWHDMSVRLEGRAVLSLQRVFSEDWHFAANELLAGRAYYPEMPPHPAGEEADSLVQIVNSAPSDELVTEMHQIYFSMLSSARRRAWLMTPYFIPDESIQTVLANQALGGVDVRVVVPRRIQEWLVGSAARSFFPPLVEAGVRIFCFRPDATLHAKALLIDDGLMILGSANLDQRSFRINFETGALIHGPAFMPHLERYFRSIMGESQQLTHEDILRRRWPERTLESVARLAAPLF